MMRTRSFAIWFVPLGAVACLSLAVFDFLDSLLSPPGICLIDPCFWVWWPNVAVIPPLLVAGAALLLLSLGKAPQVWRGPPAAIGASVFSTILGSWILEQGLQIGARWGSLFTTYWGDSRFLYPWVNISAGLGLYWMAAWGWCSVLRARVPTELD